MTKRAASEGVRTRVHRETSEERLNRAAADLSAALDRVDAVPIAVTQDEDSLATSIADCIRPVALRHG